jgi:DNA polymerase
MGDLRGEWQFHNATPVMPTYHPAYLLRSPKQKARVWQDLKKIIRALHGESPAPPAQM